MANLTAANIKELATLAPDVAKAIKELQTRLHIRKVGYTVKAAGRPYYMGEGERIEFFALNGKRLVATMVTESTLGCANDGINYRIGDSTPMPEGTWVVSHELFLGKWFINVTYFGLAQLS